jgi:hypothetical protein
MRSILRARSAGMRQTTVHTAGIELVTTNLAAMTSVDVIEIGTALICPREPRNATQFFYGGLRT